jgi:hypothetical protein
VALLETENSILQCSDLSPRGSEESGSFGSSRSRRARSQRRSAEKVARHLLNRLDRTLVSNDGRSESNVQVSIFFYYKTFFFVTDASKITCGLYYKPILIVI